MSSQLGDPLGCPYINVTMMPLQRPDHNERAVMITYQLRKGQPYQHHFAEVDRYSPEWSILRAASEMFLALERAQQPITSADIRAAWEQASREYVAPF